MAAPPFKPAKLCNADKPVTEKWYISFWAWDAVKGVKIRKRCYKVNQYKTKNERLQYAKKRCAAINSVLADGFHFNSKATKINQVALYANKERNFSIKEAFEYILPIIKNSKRPATYNSYFSLSSLFLDFCLEAGWIDWKIKTLDQADVLSFLDYMQSRRTEMKGKKEVSKKGIENITRNKYLSFLSAIFSELQQRKALEINPAKGIVFLKEQSGGNVAYTPEQIAVLKTAITKANGRLWCFVTFMLYGFIRPAEIGRLRVSMVNLVSGEIRLPGTITKNGKPRTVTISPHFRAYIMPLELSQYKPDELIFGYNLLTCKMPLQKNFAGRLHTEIARELGFGKDYTLYSWKHTGVVLHYKAGIDIKTLQKQIGHQSLHETDVYLKSLDLYENSEIVDKSPAI